MPAFYVDGSAQSFFESLHLPGRGNFAEKSAAEARGSKLHHLNIPSRHMGRVCLGF